MKKIKLRFLKGCAVIGASMMVAIFLTLILDELVRKYGHEARFSVIFIIGGSIQGIAAVIFAIVIWTNNNGEPLKTTGKYLDESDYIKECKSTLGYHRPY